MFILDDSAEHDLRPVAMQEVLLCHLCRGPHHCVVLVANREIQRAHEAGDVWGNMNTHLQI